MTATTSPPETAPPRRGRWLRVALVASLALNLLFLGAVAAAVWRHRAHAASSLGYSATLLGYAQKLPATRRQEIWRHTREERRGLQPLRAEVRAARQEWREALGTEPFDRDRFARAQARVLEAENRARAEAQRLFLAIAGQLSREERAAFLRWSAHGERPRRGFGRGSPPDGDTPGEGGDLRAPVPR